MFPVILTTDRKAFEVIKGQIELVIEGELQTHGDATLIESLSRVLDQLNKQM